MRTAERILGLALTVGLLALVAGGTLATSAELAPGARGAQGRSAQSTRAAASACHPEGDVVRVPGLFELSGLAVSRRTPDRVWAHNDSGPSVLVALTRDGHVAGRVRIEGARLTDWEAIAVGPCPAGSCVYAGDIGDNDASRRRIAVYRFPEPSSGQVTVAATEVFYATYPDGPHDAETLLITPEGRLFIVTKGDGGPVALYRFPAALKVGSTHPLERVGEPRHGPNTARRDRVTDGTVSADGRWVVLRTGTAMTFHRAAALLSGDWTSERTVDVTGVREPQGEAVALGGSGMVFLGGEGGKQSAPGTFARLACPTMSE